MTGATKTRWLNRTVLGIGFASLFSDVGHEMATAAMPVLLASFGASSAALGAIEGLADGASSFAKLLSGLYSDRLRRRKPVAVIGYFLTASGMASFAVVTNAWQVLAGRVGGWLGRGARSPVRKVLLAEATTKETYGRAFGLERSMDSAGAVLGPMLSVALMATVGIRGMFALTLIPGLIAALLLAFVVQEKNHAPKPAIHLWADVRELPRTFRRFLVGAGIAGLGDFSSTLLILFATQAWTPRLGASRAATLAMSFYVGYNIVYTLSCLLAGMLADRFPAQRVLASGYALAVVPAAALLVPGDSLAKYVVVFGASGLYMGFWETVESTTAATYLPDHVRGTGFGILDTVNGIGDLVSSAVVGVLWGLHPDAAMIFVMVTALVGAGVIATTRPVASAAERLPAKPPMSLTRLGRSR